MVLPYREVRFDEHGTIRDDTSSELFAEPGLTDLMVIAHGWNNNADEARDLYTELTGRVEAHLAAAAPDRRLGVLGVLWPSKRFDLPGQAPAAGDGHAAGLSGDADPSMALPAVLAALDLLAALLEPHHEAMVEDARRRADRLNEAAHREAYARDLLTVLAAAASPDDAFAVDLSSVGPETLDDLADLTAVDLDEVPAPATAAVGAHALPPDPASPTPADGSAAGLFGGRGFLDTALMLANATTYYVMKARAGTVGAAGLAGILDRVQLRPGNGTRLHLVGHSFGARLVSAAANAVPEVPVTSMSLLQAAFSHFAFSDDWTSSVDLAPGDFHGVLDGALMGPMLVTHTRNDTAVGLAYALASRLRGKVAANAIGDADDPFGGLGSNGAQRTPRTVTGTLRDPRTPYDLEPRSVHNLLADRYVTGHGDVRNEAVAWAVASALMWEP